MALTVASVLAGIGQFLQASQQSAFAEPLPTAAQQSFARCERPPQGILER